MMNLPDNVKANKLACFNDHMKDYQVYHTDNLKFHSNIQYAVCDGKYFYENMRTMKTPTRRINMNSLELEDIIQVDRETTAIIGIDNKRENLIVVYEDKKDEDTKSSDFYLCIYNIETKEIVKRFLTNMKFGYAWTAILKHVSADDRYIYVISSIKSSREHTYALSRLDTQTGEFCNLYTENKQHFRFIGVSPDNKYAVIVFDSGNSVCLNIEKDKIAHTDFSYAFGNYYGDLSTASLTDTTMAYTSYGKTIYVYDYVRRKMITSLSMADINTYSFQKSFDSRSFEPAYENITVYTNAGCRLLCILYTEMNGSRTYADIVNADNQAVLLRISNTKNHFMNEKFINALKEHNFHPMDITQIQYTYRKNVIRKNLSYVSGMSLSYSPKSNCIAVGGSEHTFRPVLNVFDLNTFEMHKPIYGNEGIINRVRLYDNVLAVYARTVHGYSTVNRWDINTGMLLKKEKENHRKDKSKESNFYGTKYIVCFINDDKNIKLRDKNSGEEVVLTPPEGNTFNFLQFSNNINAVYTKDDTGAVYRWDVPKANTPGYKPFFITDKVDEYHTPSHYANESHNGKYLAINGKNYIYDTAEQKKLFEFKDKLDYENMIHIDDDLRFIITKKYNKTLHIKSGTANETLEDIHLFSDGRFIVQTPPDNIAANGWFYTNCPDDMNIYIKHTDGSVKLLNPGSKIRQKYLMMYNRKDMAKNIMLNRRIYRASTVLIKAKTEIESKKQITCEKLLLNE